MSFANLHEDIAELFDGFQETFAEEVRRQTLTGDFAGNMEAAERAVSAGTDRVNSGYTFLQTGNATTVRGVGSPSAGKFGGQLRTSAERKAYKRAHAMKVAGDDIRARLLAGERPLWCTRRCRGPAPTNWIRIAAELGITLTKAA